MLWARIGTRLTVAGIGAALAAGCQTAREPVAAGPGAPGRVQLAGAAPARPVRPVAGAIAPGASQVRPANLEQPAPVEPNAIDLAVALRLAGVDNPTINLAREVVQEALAGQLAARALLLPNVNVGGNYRLHRGSYLAAPGFVRDVNIESFYLGAGAGVSGGGAAIMPGVQLFAHLGDAAYEPLAARQRVTARRSEAHAVQNETLLAVAVAYLELVGAEALRDIVRQGEVDLTEIARLTTAYAKAGQGRQADANRATANLDLLRREFRRVEEEVGTASARLCQLLNLDPSVRLRTPGGEVRPIRLLPEDTDPEVLTASALQARPEVSARSAALAEARTRERQERARPFLPVLSVGYSYGGFGGNVTAADFGPLRGRSEFEAVAVWNVQNLGFGNRALVRGAAANVGAAVARYDLTVNQIRREVTEALAAARAAATQMKTAETALGVAEEGFKLESDRIKQGPGRPLELIDSFRQLLESRQELLRATVAFNTAQFRLFVAVGNTPGQ